MERTYIDILSELWNMIKSDNIPKKEKKKILFVIEKLESLLEKYSG